MNAANDEFLKLQMGRRFAMTCDNFLEWLGTPEILIIAST